MAKTQLAKLPTRNLSSDKLNIWQMILSVFGLFLGVAGFSVGITGMFVILDEEKTSALSQSAFGVWWWSLIKFNPYISAIAVNGGLIFTFLCLSLLFKHREAIKSALEAEAAGSSKKGKSKKNGDSANSNGQSKKQK